MPYQYFPNVLRGLQTVFHDFRSNLTIVSRVFWGIPRLFPMTFGATISMFLEYFQGSPDYFWRLPEQVDQCFASVLGVPRLFPMTFGATISLFLEYFGGSQDYFWRLPEHVAQCFVSVLEVVRLSGDFWSKYILVAQVFGGWGTSLTHRILFSQIISIYTPQVRATPIRIP
jgi:phage-related protein